MTEETKELPARVIQLAGGSIAVYQYIPLTHDMRVHVRVTETSSRSHHKEGDIVLIARPRQWKLKDDLEYREV